MKASARTVSYTHLDVYKRQGYELGGRIEREGKKDGFALDVEMWDQAWIIDE